MSKKAILSTAIDADLKKAATVYCNAHGLKLQYLIEQALLERLEDAVDLEIYQKRRNEETVPLEQILKEYKTR